MLAFTLCLTASTCLATTLPPSPLERNHAARASTSAEIADDLAALAGASPLAEVTEVGTSVEGRPLTALRLAAPARAGSSPRLTVLMVASQHGGAEPAGGEAMLALARELLDGALRPLLDDLDVVLLPNVNADGREHGRRANAHGVNLNTDYVAASQPETRAVLATLERFRPQVVLDVHESAVLKRKSLARDGYLTDFDAQFEFANNPAVPARLRARMADDLLPALVARTSAAGLPAQRYIGEITRLDQPITNGGLTLRNLRNLAASDGICAFLLETRQEPRDDPAPTPRNLAMRSARSLLAQRVFLEVVHARRAALVDDVARAYGELPKEPLALYAQYSAVAGQATVDLPLRERDSRARVMHRFADHRAVTVADVVPMPATYVLLAPGDALLDLLDHHRIKYERLAEPLEVPVVAERYALPAAPDGRVTVTASAPRLLRAPHGAVFIDLVQRHGRRVPLLLDPRSISSPFRAPPFSAQVAGDAELPIYRVHKGVVQSAAVSQ